MRIAVLGAYGEMGRITVTDLVETCKNCEIVAVGRDGKKLRELEKLFNKSKLKTKKNKLKFVSKVADVTNIKQTAQAIKGCDVVINAAQYYYNLHAMKACLLAKANYLDLGGLFHFTKKQLRLHGKFRKKKLLAVLGMGATPGITNVLASFGAKKFGRIDSINVSFADKDFTKYTLPFVVPYSMQTIFDEFTMKPAVFRNGKIVFVQPMSGIKKIFFPKPVNSADCFYTLHSEVATFPVSFRQKGIKNCSFKGGFDKEFVKKIRFLIDAELASTKPVKINGIKSSPREFTVKALNQFIPGKETRFNDIEFLRVEITGKQKNRKKKLVLYCKSFSNKKWNFAAGAWNTAVAPSIAAQMIAKKQVNAVGAMPPEKCVPEKEFFKELEKRNMKVFVGKK